MSPQQKNKTIYGKQRQDQNETIGNVRVEPRSVNRKSIYTRNGNDSMLTNLTTKEVNQHK